MGIIATMVALVTVAKLPYASLISHLSSGIQIARRLDESDATKLGPASYYTVIFHFIRALKPHSAAGRADTNSVTHNGNSSHRKLYVIDNYADFLSYKNDTK